MRKLTVLLPSEDTEKHILVAVQKSKFTIPDAYTTDIEWKLSQKGTDFTQNWAIFRLAPSAKPPIKPCTLPNGKDAT